jgi:hypothetical protein
MLCIEEDCSIRIYPYHIFHPARDNSEDTEPPAIPPIWCSLPAHVSFSDVEQVYMNPSASCLAYRLASSSSTIHLCSVGSHAYWTLPPEKEKASKKDDTTAWTSFFSFLSDTECIVVSSVGISFYALPTKAKEHAKGSSSLKCLRTWKIAILFVLGWDEERQCLIYKTKDSTNLTCLFLQPLSATSKSAGAAASSKLELKYSSDATASSPCALLYLYDTLYFICTLSKAGRSYCRIWPLSIGRLPRQRITLPNGQIIYALASSVASHSHSSSSSSSSSSSNTNANASVSTSVSAAGAGWALSVWVPLERGDNQDMFAKGEGEGNMAPGMKARRCDGSGWEINLGGTLREGSFCVVDNILVLLCEGYLAVLVDVRHGMQAPIAPPLPIAMPSSRGDPSLLFLSGTHLALDPVHGLWWEMGLHPESLMESWDGGRAALLAFLCRRSEGRQLALYTLKSAVEDQLPLQVLGGLFDFVNSIGNAAIVARKKSPSPSSSFVTSTPMSRSMSLQQLSQPLKDAGETHTPPVGDLGRLPSAPVISPPWFTSPASPIPSSSHGSDRKPSAVGVKGKAATETITPSPSPSDFPGPAWAFRGGNGGSGGSSGVGVYTPRRCGPYVVIDQADFYSTVYMALAEEKHVSGAYLVRVLMEYMRSLLACGISPLYYIHELLVSCLVREGMYSTLHQCVQYHVIADSLPVALSLLSLEELFKPCHQLALDMLKRLPDKQSLVDVLLSSQDVMSALSATKTFQKVEVDPSAFLDAAMETGDPLVFFNVFTYLTYRHIQLKGSPDMRYLSPKMEAFHNHYVELFGSLPSFLFDINQPAWKST